MKKSISIIIPAYNEEDYIAACLDAIATQSEAPDQVIVVDNNSSDRTLEIVRRYPFVTILKEPQQGIVFARNTGFDAATSDIIGRIDVDTHVPRDWVRQIREFYADPRHAEVTLTGGGYFYNLRLPRVNGWLHGLFAYRLDRLIVGHYVLWGSNMAIPAVVWSAVRREACTRNDIHEDFDLSFHIDHQSRSIAYLPTLKVGASLGRMFRDRHVLKAYMRKWPLTLRVHGYRMWWLGVVGNVLLWYFVRPIVYITEYTARLFGKPPLWK